MFMTYEFDTETWENDAIIEGTTICPSCDRDLFEDGFGENCGEWDTADCATCDGCGCLECA